MLTALALSGGFHLWHHVTDATCESPEQGKSHPCSLCSALHGAALAEAQQRSSAPAATPHTRVVLPATPGRADLRHHDDAPRAPPAA